RSAGVRRGDAERRDPDSGPDRSGSGPDRPVQGRPARTSAEAGGGVPADPEDDRGDQPPGADGPRGGQRSATADPGSPGAGRRAGVLRAKEGPAPGQRAAVGGSAATLGGPAGRRDPGDPAS